MNGGCGVCLVCCYMLVRARFGWGLLGFAAGWLVGVLLFCLGSGWFVLGCMVYVGWYLICGLFIVWLFTFGFILVVWLIVLVYLNYFRIK